MPGCVTLHEGLVPGPTVQDHILHSRRGLQPGSFTCGCLPDQHYLWVFVVTCLAAALLSCRICLREHDESSGVLSAQAVILIWSSWSSSSSWNWQDSQCPASPSSHLKARGGLFPAQVSCSMSSVSQGRMASASSWSLTCSTGITVAKRRPSKICPC